eukprot:UN22920
MVLRDVNAPTRTRSAYMYFCDKHRDSVENDNPDASMVEVSALMGKLWSETSEKARAPFVSKMEKSKAKFEKEMEVYRQTSEYEEFQKTKKTHNLIVKYVEKIPDAKKKNVYKSFPSDPNKPKKPMSSYFYLQTTTEMLWLRRTLMQVWQKLEKCWAKPGKTPVTQLDQNITKNKQIYKKNMRLR